MQKTVHNKNTFSHHPMVWCLAFAISIAFHGLLIFFVWPENNQFSSKGNARVILLEPSPTPEPPRVKEKSKPKKASNKITPENPANREPRPSKKGIQSTSSAKPKPVTEASEKQMEQDARRTIKASRGDQTDNLGKEETSSAKQTYRQKVAQHLLKNMEGAPASGSATLELKIMRAGVAIQVEIQNLSGPKQFGDWLYRKALEANPYPPFSEDDADSTKLISIPMTFIEDTP